VFQPKNAPSGWRDPAGAFAELYGVSRSGAVLVRPDGFVARRAKEAVSNPQQTLASVIQRLVPALAPNR
jgi:putative polyketide hydroxylase